MAISKEQAKEEIQKLIDDLNPRDWEGTVEIRRWCRERLTNKKIHQGEGK